MVGVLTESDLLRLLSNPKSCNSEVIKAMRASVVGFSEDTNLQEIFEFVVRVSIPQVVILRDGRPCGVVGRKAILQWLYSNGFEQESDSQTNGPKGSPPTGPPPITMPQSSSNSDGALS